MLRIALLHLGHLAQIDLDAPVADELDIVEAHDALAVPIRSRIARAHVGDRLADCLPYRSAPTGVEGAHDLFAVLVGGAEASQKGLGELMLPAKPRTRMSGMGHLRSLEHRKSGALAAGHRIHHFAAAVHAIAACIVARIAGLAGGQIRNDAPIAHFHAAQFLNELAQAATGRWPAPPNRSR